MEESTDRPVRRQPAVEAGAEAEAGRPGGHRRTRLLLGFLTLAAVAAMVPLAALAHRDLLTNAGSGLVLLAPFAVVGALVARRLPGNPIGWLSLAFALCFLLSNDAGFYLIANYRLGRQLPLSPVMLFLQPLWEVSLLSLPLVVLLFPDGRLPSPRWRTAQWSYIALCALFGIVACARAAYALAAHRVHVDSSGDLTTVIHGAGWANAASAPGFVLLVMFSLSFAGRQALSWRRSSGERREQLKWLVSGAAVSVVSVVLSVQIGSASGFRHVVANLLAFGLAATPLGIGMGILKYRLYDIDRIISRTLAYAMVTGLLVGVYGGLVLLATHLLSVSSPVAVAASTLAAAALFNPLRRRVQRAVDRRFNRSRYDADEMAAAFAAHVAATDPAGQLHAEDDGRMRVGGHYPTAGALHAAETLVDRDQVPGLEARPGGRGKISRQRATAIAPAGYGGSVRQAGAGRPPRAARRGGRAAGPDCGGRPARSCPRWPPGR